MAATNAPADNDAYAIFKTVYKTSRATFDTRVAALRPNAKTPQGTGQ
jgi:hypothetical protein